MKRLAIFENKRLVFFLILLAATDASIFLNVPVLRQFLGFFFFTIAPGWLVLQVFKPKAMGAAEKILLSVGLSVSFLMLVGLFINWLYPWLGYATPLSTVSLTLSFSILILMLAALVCVKDKAPFALRLPALKLSTGEMLFLLLPASFPLLSIGGMRLMNTTGNNAVLMALLLLVPAYIIFISLKPDRVPQRIYPATVFFTGLSLALLLGLRSNHIIGSDAHVEYYFFQQTLLNGRWQVLMSTSLDTTLSISLLPAIYKLFLNLDSEILFKILYPLLFSISPLVVYVIARRYLCGFHAWLASLFFMVAVPRIFLWTAYHPRTVIAILFLDLSIMALFSPHLSGLARKAIFVIFFVGCIISHYSTAYIFFFVLVIAWMVLGIAKRLNLSKTKAPAQAGDPGSMRAQIGPGITLGMIAIFFAIIFFWYGQVTAMVFQSGIWFIANTLAKLQNFFIIDADTSLAASAAMSQNMLYKIVLDPLEHVLFYLPKMIIVIGVLLPLWHYLRKGLPSASRGLVEQKPELEYLVFGLACGLMWIALIITVVVTNGYGKDRGELALMGVLSPFIVVGAGVVAGWMKKRATVILLPLLILAFLFSSGAAYQICGIPQEIILNSTGDKYHDLYIHDQESYAARWIKEKVNLEYRIFADMRGDRLTSQGLIPPEKIDIFTRLRPNDDIDGTVYLRYRNVVDNKVRTRDNEVELKEYAYICEKRTKMYTNGGSEIYLGF